MPAGQTHEAGVPEDVMQNLVLDHDTTSALIAKRAVDFVNFTGSVGGGRSIERAAAGTFIPASTELGGKDPGYVRADADMDAAVDTLMDGAMFNSGQSCCGIERIHVQEPLFDAFVETAVGWANAQRLGNLAPGHIHREEVIEHQRMARSCDVVEPDAQDRQQRQQHDARPGKPADGRCSWLCA